MSKSLYTGMPSRATPASMKAHEVLRSRVHYHARADEIKTTTPSDTCVGWMAGGH